MLNKSEYLIYLHCVLSEQKEKDVCQRIRDLIYNNSKVDLHQMHSSLTKRYPGLMNPNQFSRNKSIDLVFQN